MGGILIYEANNSGGHWWLSTEDWKRLDDAGWTVHWLHDVALDHGVDFEGKGDEKKDPHLWNKDWGKTHNHQYGSNELKLVKVPFDKKVESWLGAYATSAAKRFDNPDDGVDEWERVSIQNASDEGCNCCGPPHSFTWESDDGNKRRSSVEVVQTRMNWW